MEIKYSLDDLNELFKEYFKTLPDDDEEEYYMSSQLFADLFVPPFLDWLRTKEGTNKNEKPE